jgi:hypothetical protein
MSTGHKFYLTKFCTLVTLGASGVRAGTIGYGLVNVIAAA